MNQNFLQLSNQEGLRRSTMILEKIEALIENIPNSWKTRYSDAGMNLEIALDSFLDFIHRANKWRKENQHKTDEEYFRKRLPKSNVLCDAQGNFYDK